jgi:hypothetical protein
MKITDRGLVFEGYRCASPSTGYCSFTDKGGATLLIEATTLVKMYELVKFDLERRGGWQAVMSELENLNETP